MPPTRCSRAVPRRPRARASSGWRWAAPAWDRRESSSTASASRGPEHATVATRGPLLVLQPFDHMLEPGDRVGIVGPNGAGKSTLLDLIAGRLHPTLGSIDIGRTVKIGYYDQLGRDLDLDQRVRDAVAGGKGEPTLDDVKLMRRFWFDGDAQFAPISTLSGGERRRLQLLLTLLEQPNVLLLDEPTNDLDLDTLRALEDFLDDWPGIVVVVSHDRVFLDRTVTEVLALDGNGRAVVVRGGVAGWLALHAARPTVAPGTAGSTSAGHAPRRVTAPPAAPPVSTKSPSTLRHQLGRADRELADAIADRDDVQAELVAVVADHEELARLGAQLATTQKRVDAAEERWLSLADEAESLRMEF